MLFFILKRIFNSIITLFFVITVTFFMIKLSPGNPFSGEKISEESIKALERMYNVDKNVFLQYIDYMKNLIFYQDFGLSFKNIGVKVNDLIFPDDSESGFWLSVKFGLIVLIIVIFCGITLGIIAALKENSKIDKFINVFTIAGVSIPPIVTAPILVLLFSVILRLFPPIGWGLDFSHLFLPIISLSLPNICFLAQIQRNSILDVMNSNFILAARAKGLPKKMIIVKHALKPSLIPAISFLGPTTAGIVSGSVVIEKIFLFPGIGTLTVSSALNRDYSLILALVIIYSCILIFCNTIVDILYTFISPQIKLISIILGESFFLI